MPKTKTKTKPSDQASLILKDCFRNYLCSRKCFACRSAEGLNFSHIKEKCKNPSQMIRYHVPSNRPSKTAELMAELMKGGILCADCHRAYDGVKRYGWPKKRWHDKYTKEGRTAKGANWEAWKVKHLECSLHCDEMMSALPG